MNDSVKFNADYLKDFEYNWNCTKYYTSIIVYV